LDFILRVNDGENVECGEINTDSLHLSSIFRLFYPRKKARENELFIQSFKKIPYFSIS